jgi:putative tricarboxylic transport membrane protein
VDLGVAAAFLAFSLTVIALALRMPRFAEQGGEIYTAPGLVPAFYGMILAALSLWLGYQALQRGALRAMQTRATAEPGNSTARLAIAAALGVLFVVGLVGKMPFWLAVAIFVSLFIVIFEWQPGLPMALRARRIATALVQALITGFLVTLVFEKIFLVRLP